MTEISTATKAEWSALVGGTPPRFPVVLRHMIWKPTEVSVSDAAARVVDAEGTATVVAFFPVS